MLLKLSENIASHICHELANSIGACDTCLDSFVSSGPEGLATARMASQSSVNRLKYLRYLYGYNVAPALIYELAGIASALIKEGRTCVEFNLNGLPFNGEIEKKANFRLDTADGKLLLAFIYISHGDMPYGGVIQVDIEHNPDRQHNEIKVSSKSDQLKFRDNVYQVLQSQEVSSDDVSSRNVMVYYARELAVSSDIKYRVVVTQGKVEYIFPYKYISGDQY